MSVNTTAFSLNIQSAIQLKSLFMDKVTHGGIIIESIKNITMGDEILLMISLPDNLPRTPVKGKIVWLSTGKKDILKYFGVQFVEDKTGLQNRIYKILSTLKEDEDCDIIAF